MDATNALSSDLMALLDNESTSDFKLVCSRGEEVKVHKFILSMRSSVFATMLQGDRWREVEKGEVKIEKYSIRVVRAMVKFIYSAKIEDEFNDFEELLKIGHQYELHSLVKECGKRLIFKLSKTNAFQVGMFAEKYGAMDLFKAAADTVAKDLSGLPEDWLEHAGNYLGFLTALVSSFKNKQTDEQKIRLVRFHSDRREEFDDGSFVTSCHINFSLNHSAVLLELEVMNGPNQGTCTIEIKTEDGTQSHTESKTMTNYTQNNKTSQLKLSTPINIAAGVQYSLGVTAGQNMREMGSSMLYRAPDKQPGDQKLMVTFNREKSKIWNDNGGRRENILENSALVSLVFRLAGE